MRLVSVLCAARNSVYKQIEGVDVFDIDRDARNFSGDTPIVAHPPCRSWSAYCAHQAKATQEERDLAIWCCEQLRTCGGVLEQPAHSRLFSAGGLPLPGDGERGGLWSIACNQSWWGHPVIKRTWLCFSRIEKSRIEVPFLLRDERQVDRRRWQVMSKHQRSATPYQFAEWLVAAARMVV